VRWAAHEAVIRNKILTIVHVDTPLIGGWSSVGMSGAPLPQEHGGGQETRTQQVIEDAVRVVRETPGGAELPVKTEIPYAPPVPALVDMTEHAQMIVVGCRGQGSFSRTLLGSLSTALIHHAHCPVAVLHGNLPAERAGAPIVVGMDGSPASELATALAFQEASWRTADLVALHAWSDSEWPDLIPLPWSAVSADAEETLS
jgi:nucleotide-binding universal stress UspA family protein